MKNTGARTACFVKGKTQVRRGVKKEFRKKHKCAKREIYFLVKNTSAQSTHSVNFKKHKWGNTKKYILKKNARV